MKKILKWFLYLLMTLLLIVAGLYFYFIYLDTPAQPDTNGELKSAQLPVDGLDRDFIYYIPENVKPNAALIFVLHGSMSKAEHMRVGTAYGYETLADKEGFIVVYPSGYENHWNDCRGGANYTANTKNIDDPAFFKAMIAYFAERYAISRQRVYATGLSNGGHMAYRLAFELPNEFAAIAPMAANIPVAESFDCQRSNQPVSVAIFNGTEDPINPFNGGVVDLAGNVSRGRVLSAQESVEYWVKLAGVNSAPFIQTVPELDGNPNTSISVQAWSSEEGVLVRLYTMQGSGHVMPSKLHNKIIELFMGGNAGDLDGVAEVWDFFQAVEAERKSVAIERVDP
ncbi:PHB depolymerase family esterase [Zhongshania sp.]|uniref:alpha/beta hydrolase family esterase n=1 Tax=Zhongshania sp. TaxID=1971902 RepID=UPI0035640923